MALNLMCSEHVIPYYFISEERCKIVGNIELGRKTFIIGYPSGNVVCEKYNSKKD